MHLKPSADLPHGQPALAAEGEKAKNLESSKAQTMRSESRIHPRHHELVHPHDGCDGGHPARRVNPPVIDPLSAGLSDRIEAQ
jgi:hypothetical protein